MDNILSILFLLPLLVVFIMLLVPSAQHTIFKRLALATTAIQLILFGILLSQFDYKLSPTSWGDAFQFVEKAAWISLDLASSSSFKVHYFIGVDGISIVMVGLSTLILFLGVVASWGVTRQIKAYFVLYLLINCGIIGTFIALDLFLFYLCFEVILLPMFFLIGIWGGARRSYASIKFFLYTLLGSLCILVVIIGLYLSGSDGSGYTFSLVHLMNGDYMMGSILAPGTDQLFWGIPARVCAVILLIIGFGIKLPVVPLHTWLPDAHVEAPTPISMILAGILLKVGGYGFFRLVYGIFPSESLELSWLIGTLGAISIVYGALNALSQNDFKKLVAYSSIAHMGFVLVGMASNTYEGMSGALFHMLSHGLISVALFSLVGVVLHRTQSKQLDSFSGLASKMPVYTFFVGFFFFAALGLPGMSGFVGELLVLIGVFKSPILPFWVGIICVLGILLSAAYFIWTLQKMFLGSFFVRKKEWSSLLVDLHWDEKFVLIPIASLVLILGLFPSLVTDIFDETIRFFVQHVRHLP